MPKRNPIKETALDEKQALICKRFSISDNPEIREIYERNNTELNTLHVHLAVTDIVARTQWRT